MTPLSGWEDYYVIVGSSAGALIGLQFVVITLIAEMPIGRGAAQAGQAFATPNIVHFGAVLLLAGIQCAPWEAVSPVAILWGVIGLAGIVYVALVTRRMRLQTAYKPEFEDWLFHSILPFLAYITLAVSSLVANAHPRDWLFAIAAASMLLLFIGIHNAWDAVTYHVYSQRRKMQEAEKSATGEAKA
ncbi:MAG TPA: hypothetical protein VG897_12060 [Terriglobales bacterium]|nr:hypothetical protein [Terriglobales bacterium]